ncbi:hypothetical protein [Streptomyces sp. NPDC093060]|uniref:hypothetical protein n=1 Tax=Streptomyces sp. NPDC093060 TaxID=3366019 RepID=UPI00382F57C9
MRHPRLLAGRAVVAFAMAAALLTGCGVQQTGVVEAGGSATVAVSASPGRRGLLLYFLSSDDRVTPVFRMLSNGDEADAHPPPVSRAKTLAVLFAGPRDNEIAAGLHTELPRTQGSLQVDATDAGVTIHLPIAVRTLKPAAVQQIVCTAAYAEGGGAAEVTIWGEDGDLPGTHCR